MIQSSCTRVAFGGWNLHVALEPATVKHVILSHIAALYTRGCWPTFQKAAILTFPLAGRQIVLVKYVTNIEVFHADQIPRKG